MFWGVLRDGMSGRISKFGRVLAGCLLAVIATVGVSCKTVEKPYDVKAYKPKNPNNVRVKISTENQVIYVLEGDRPLMVAACSVGTAATPTPKGNFTIYHKDKDRRRRSQPGRRYPMGFWCEFKSAYGIHAGWVHPAPRTKGCVRLHFDVAPKFFALVKEGTPLNIARRQPEDQTLGKNVPRPMDYADPEFPPHILNTDKMLDLYKGPLFDG